VRGVFAGKSLGLFVDVVLVDEEVEPAEADVSQDGKGIR
jgi:hypothetical protein